MRRILKSLIREKLENTPYYQLYSHKTDLIPIDYEVEEEVTTEAVETTVAEEVVTETTTNMAST